VFGFNDYRDQSWAPNFIDDENRYAFGKQADMAKWNLRRLANAFTGTPFFADGQYSHKHAACKMSACITAHKRYSLLLR